MIVSKELKRNLERSLKIYHSEKHLVGRLCNAQLQELILFINQEQSVDRFIQFVNCLNFFYSTRLQLAVGRPADNIIKVAKILQANWSRGLELEKVEHGQVVDPKKVDKLREKIRKSLENDFFSFTTKVFHQLNSQHPIYDSRVNRFMKKTVEIGRIRLNESYEIFYQYFINMTKDIEWDVNKIDELDNAIWGYEDLISKS